MFEFRKLLRSLLTSPHMAAFWFASLAAFTIVGTLIPQIPQVGSEGLRDRYGEDTFNLLNNLGVTDIFNSWLFALVTFLLSVNLIAATFIRVFPRGKKAITWPGFITAGRGNADETLPESKWNDMVQFLTRSGWKLRVNSSGDSLVARKGSHHRLGPSITHTGILIVLLGVAVNQLFGFNGSFRGIPGEEFLLTDRPDDSSKGPAQRSNILVRTANIFRSKLWMGLSPDLQIKIISTDRTDNPDGSPAQWSTELEFQTQGGDALKKMTMEVNKPVQFLDIQFYQADWKKVIRLKLNDNFYELELSPTPKRGGEIASIEMNKELKLAFWKPNSSEAINLLLLKQNLYVPLAKLSPGQVYSVGEAMRLEYVGAYPQTGVQFKRSPGDLWVLVGMAVLLVGAFVSMGAMKTIWAWRDHEGRISLLKRSDRLRVQFAAEFQALLSKLRDGAVN